MNKPRYTHDCNQCTFLGPFKDADLYYCPQIGIPTVIARFSSSGADYQSGLFDPHTPALQEAKVRAMAREFFNGKRELNRILAATPTALGSQPVTGRFQGFLLWFKRFTHLNVW